ncbi:hypothetical protein ACFL5J_01570 [Thermodesulfobacteriota bacterium]
MILLLAAVPVRAGEVSVWSGGVGDEERLAAPYGNVKIVLFQQGGNYLADAEVVIYDLTRRKVVVREQVKGPWCIVDLPPGSYSVLASRKNGDRQGTRFVVAQDKNVEFSLMFPAR